ncbi:MAG: hypothetical protein DMF72_18760 [Acidobacteria bacterium]|nr:MAG: hypothetical protein DMF72_18760 [Acidobacteriota bacterium]
MLGIFVSMSVAWDLELIRSLDPRSLGDGRNLVVIEPQLPAFDLTTNRHKQNLSGTETDKTNSYARRV